MEHTGYTLETREGKMYAVQHFIDDSEPRAIANWYLLTVNLEDFTSWFAHPDLMKKKLGGELHPLNNTPITKWQDEAGWPFLLTTGPSEQRVRAFLSITLIPVYDKNAPPPLRWENGAWRIVSEAR